MRLAGWAVGAATALAVDWDRGGGVVVAERRRLRPRTGDVVSDLDALVDFLRGCIAEDEDTALWFRNDAGHTRGWRADETGGVVREIGPTEFGLPDVIAEGDTHLIADHIARWDPKRALDECEAKRQMVERARLVIESFEGIANEWPDVSRRERSHAWETLRLLALPYAARPGFRPEWRP